MTEIYTKILYMGLLNWLFSEKSEIVSSSTISKLVFLLDMHCDFFEISEVDAGTELLNVIKMSFLYYIIYAC